MNAQYKAQEYLRQAARAHAAKHARLAQNPAKYVLQSMDDCHIYRDRAGAITFDWIPLLWREQNKQLDVNAIGRLVKAGYLVWERYDSERDQLVWTARGFVIVYAYRPVHSRAFPLYPNYRNWLRNADRIKSYVAYTESHQE